MGFYQTGRRFNSVAGVNHAQTNMSSYSSMSIYDATYLWGVEEVGDTLADTVWKYLNLTDFNDVQQRHYRIFKSMN